MADSVRISKTYLDTLLRRAELHEPEDSIKLSLTHYNRLFENARRFQCLKAALVAGGASEETVEVLVNSQSLPLYDSDHKDNVFVEGPRWSEDDAILFNAKMQQAGTTKAYHSNKNDLKAEYIGGPLLPPSPTSIEHGDQGQGTSESGEQDCLLESNQGDRSLVLLGISNATSSLDLTTVIRGGMLSNVYVRRREHSAHVSFVSPKAAARFWTYSQQNRITIKGRTIKVFWDSHQPGLPGFIMNRILYNGATRNLVVRFPRSDMTEKSLREDLEHIHRLEVLDIKFEDEHAWIQLNSIQCAITAKTCMQSRLKYRRSRIEFFADECGKPLSTISTTNKWKQTSDVLVRPAIVPCTNRFDALLAVSFDDESEEEESD